MTIITLDPSDVANIVLTWDNLGSATISSVTYPNVPSGLTLTPQGTTTTTSTVRVSGMTHGRTYQLEAQATLSTGETLNRNFPVRAFNG